MSSTEAFLVTYVILLLKLNSASQTPIVPLSPPTNIGDSFLLQLEGCTASLISKDWAITAAHCLQEYKSWGNVRRNEFGDLEILLSDDDLIVRKSEIRHPFDKSQGWTKALTPPAKRSRDPFWRTIDRAILNGRFEGEALSWKGYDLALLHLTDTYGRDASSPETASAIYPVCLATKGFQDLNDKVGPVFMAGFGRRHLPHCFTNEHGPEVNEVCARPVSCSHDHRTMNCGIKFNYQGKTFNSCSQDETPSASEPECVQMRESNPHMASLQRTVHIFQDSKYLTSCYPKKAPEGSKGWCVTRQQGVDIDKEPTGTSGWGFCSDSPQQKSCTGFVQHSIDTSDLETTLLDDSYCVDKLEANLIVEQPGVNRQIYDPLLPKSHLICIGRNHSRNTNEDLFLKKDGLIYVHFKPNQNEVRQLEQAGHYDKFLIDGGPSCFGDSGGPLWRLVNDRNGKQTPTPVLFGVFSFMLWGTCVGRNEPGYYVRLIDFEDWIFSYVPKNQVCTYPINNKMF